MNYPSPIYEFSDLLDWVGESSYVTIDDYVQEATRQGCSRRMPQLPDGLIPGYSRVFLAHKNKQKDAEHGVVFGFFALCRVQIIASPQSWYFLRHRKKYLPRWDPQIDNIPSEPIVRRSFPKWVAQDRHFRPIKRPKSQPSHRNEADELLEDLWNELGEADEEGLIDYVIDLLLDNEPNRGCGSREMGGIYLIDDLAGKVVAWLLEDFADFLEQKLSVPPAQFVQQVEQRRTKNHYAENGISPNGRFVREVKYADVIHLRHLGYGGANIDVPQAIPTDGKWERIPHLVLLPQPYPILCRSPQAAFRSYQRIDGDALLLKANAEHLMRKSSIHQHRTLTSRFQMHYP